MQSSQNLLRELARNVNKLFRDLKGLDAPDAMVYLRLLGMELGYLKTKDIENMAYSALLMADNLMGMFPAEVSFVTKQQHKQNREIVNRNRQTILIC